MYIFSPDPAGKYAVAAISKRDGKDTEKTYTYLGRIIDRNAGIYKNRKRGLFTFDPATNQFGEVSAEIAAEYARQEEDRKAQRQERKDYSVDFGDGFFLNAFLCQSGFMRVIDEIDFENRDTLHAMLLFYILSRNANCYALDWYSGNIVSLLYPNAAMTSQRISDFLTAIGTTENRIKFQRAYINFVRKNYTKDNNVLIDSSGLPNNIKFPLTSTTVHNGKVSNEVRVVFVVQKSTGLPIFYLAIPGNIVDVSTLKRVFLHLEALNVDIESCILDAGYNSDENIDIFYDEQNRCKIGFLIRVKFNDKQLRIMIDEELGSLEQRENFIKFEDRYLFIKKREIKVGTNKNKSAWLYLGLDCSRLSDEQRKLIKTAKKKKLSLDEVYESMQQEGLFGILSGTNYSCEEILPTYYQRQAAEQIFDFMKNYTKALPLRVNNEDTFNGHLLLAYIACCSIKMIHMKLKSADSFLGSILTCMRNQKCTVYENNIVTDVPKKIANDTYKIFDIKCPDSLPIKDGKLLYSCHLPFVDQNEIKKQSQENASNIEEPESSTQEAAINRQKRPRGRPKGSKNKKTLEREALQADVPLQEKRPRGRPKGSKNKKTLEREALQANAPLQEKRPRGRPKGSKNKKTLEREAQMAKFFQQEKRSRGRPKGSKNKKTLEREALAQCAIAEPRSSSK